MPKQLHPNTVAVVEALNRIAGVPVEAKGDEYKGIFHISRFGAEPGQIRDRVWYESVTYCNRSDADAGPDWSRSVQRFVRCFVERKDDGLILYAGGWVGPAKWKDGPASEFKASEAEAYAQFTLDKGWGYKGDRARWEKRTGVSAD